MSNTYPNCNYEPDDVASLDSCAAGAAAVLDPDDEIADATSARMGPCCEKCEAPLGSDVVSVCRRCGWYASLGAFLEVDPNWETETEKLSGASEKAKPSHLGVWLKLLPRWAWVVVASVVAVTIESVVARVATPDGSAMRTAWSVGQLVLGLIVAVGCHVFNFLTLAAEDADVGLLDLLLKPLKLWQRAVQNLPTRLWVFNATVSSLAAVVFSIVVIGGIPYDRLWDWGIKERPKQDLMGAVMNRIQQLDSGKGSDDLEHSINDFAGKGNPDETKAPRPEPPKPRSNADCVILGFLTDSSGRVATLLLGAAEGGKLVYAGNVAPKMDAEDLKSLTERLYAIQSPKPIIKIETEANWVQAKFTCRVTFGQRSKNGRMHDVEWDKMLGRIGK
jgi:hypothetical protein